MGTRGTYGFVQDGEYKATYNHYDSYPSGLGAEVVSFIRGVVEKGQLDTLKKRVKNLKVVQEGSKVPAKLAKKYAEFYNGGVSDQNKEDWYCVLHGLQNGEILPHILSGKVEHITDGSDFPKDSLFCEYAYIIDLNMDTFDVYVGFQHTPQEGNMFGTEANESGYYPVKRVMSFPLSDIPQDWVKQIEEWEEKERAMTEALSEVEDEPQEKA